MQAGRDGELAQTNCPPQDSVADLEWLMQREEGAGMGQACIEDLRAASSVEGMCTVLPAIGESVEVTSDAVLLESACRASQWDGVAARRGALGPRGGGPRPVFPLRGIQGPVVHVGAARRGETGPGRVRLWGPRPAPLRPGGGGPQTWLLLVLLRFPRQVFPYSDLIVHCSGSW